MPRNQSETKKDLDDEEKVDPAPACERCGDHEWFLCERATLTYELSFTGEGEATSYGSSREIYDDNNYSLECANCGHDQSAPFPLNINWE